MSRSNKPRGYGGHGYWSRANSWKKYARKLASTCFRQQERKQLHSEMQNLCPDDFINVVRADWFFERGMDSVAWKILQAQEVTYPKRTSEFIDFRWYW